MDLTDVDLTVGTSAGSAVGVWFRSDGVTDADVLGRLQVLGGQFLDLTAKLTAAAPQTSRSQAALRQAAELTQVELARRLGVTQAAISRMEQPTTCSCPPSTPTSRPSGGTARMIVRFADGHEATLDLGQLA